MHIVLSTMKELSIAIENNGGGGEPTLVKVGEGLAKEVTSKT